MYMFLTGEETFILGEGASSVAQSLNFPSSCCATQNITLQHDHHLSAQSSVWDTAIWISFSDLDVPVGTYFLVSVTGWIFVENMFTVTCLRFTQDCPLVFLQFLNQHDEKYSNQLTIADSKRLVYNTRTLIFNGTFVKLVVVPVREQQTDYYAGFRFTASLHPSK